MVFLLVVLVLPLVILFFLRKQRIHGAKTNLLPPGPPGLPFIGNLHQIFNSTSPHIFLCQLSEKYGPLMSLKLGSRQTLVISSAKMAKEALKTHDIEFCGRPAVFAMKKLSYNNQDITFAPYGQYWREIRKICVVHLFNSTRSQLYRPIREDQVSRMIQKISKSSLLASNPINLSRETMSLTNGVICRVAFGEKYGDEVADVNKFEEMCKGIQAMVSGFFFSDYFPLMGWVDRLTGMMSRLEKYYIKADAFYQPLIDKHLDPNRQNPEKEDIIDILLRVMNDPESTLNLSFDNIKGVLMNVLIAGTETSLSTVIWAMTYLMKHPEVMRKVQGEIRGFIGDSGKVTEDDIEKLPYLKAVVKETFRLQPAAPLSVPRETIQKCNIGGYEIPAKTFVYVNAWAIGRDIEAWGENVEEFYPERFMGSSIDYKGQDFELIPFGSGRRICPGMHMGAAIVELAVANLVYKFDWELPDGMKREEVDLDVSTGMTVHKKRALCLVAKEYQVK